MAIGHGSGYYGEGPLTIYGMVGNNQKMKSQSEGTGGKIALAGNYVQT